MIMRKTICALLFTLLFVGFKSHDNYDLAILNAKILDVKSGKVYTNRSILIRKGIIEKIVKGSKGVSANQLINAGGKLVTPSFIDTHVHPADVFGDYADSPEFLIKDSLSNYRKRLSDEFLPYGVTSVFSMGHRESWIRPLLEWQNNPDPSYVDTFTCGAAITTEGTYIGHTFVKGSAQAREKVLEYKALGMDYIKLYARTSPAEFRSAYRTADSLGMKVYGHIGDFHFNPDFITLPAALKIGLKNFEHLSTLPDAIMSKDDYALYTEQCRKLYGPRNSETKALQWILEEFRFADTYKRPEMNDLILKLAENKVTFSTAINFVYSQFGQTFFSTPADKTITPELTARCRENFKIMMHYARLMHEKGIMLRIGTDSKDGGRALLSEMLLMCEYGFSPEQVFKIATYNGAKAMGIDHQAGTIEEGKKANLIIWNADPLKGYKAITGGKTIVKGGVIFNARGQY